ncbi:hypothetical protein CCP3SC15_450007 [Gammaproteobacteria bacterium]
MALGQRPFLGKEGSMSAKSVTVLKSYFNECVKPSKEQFGDLIDSVVVAGTAATLTTALTSITASAPGTPDYAIQDLTATGGYGFATADEGQTVLKVILNLQTRLAELETKLKAVGLAA